MSVIRPTVINARPGIIIPMIGGFAGTVLLTAGMYLAPIFGLPFIDVPHVMGGIFTSSPTVAIGIGFCLHFLNGAVIFPILFGLFWPALPGPMTGIVSDCIKGLSWAVALWIASGLAMPVAEALNRLPPGVFEPAGVFGFGKGAPGAFALLAGHLLYGLALGLTCYMAADIFPMETLGWRGYVKAELPPAGTLYPKSGVPEYPSLGSR